jgi:hypothetical protein
MSFSANNPAGLPHLSQCVVGRATNSPPTRNYGDESRRSCAGHACSNQTAIVLTFRSQCADENFALVRVWRLRIPPLFRHRVGAIHAPCGSSLFCFGCAALRVTVSLQILFGQSTRKDFSGPTANAELRHLGAWPTRSTGAPTKIGRFHKRRHSCTYQLCGIGAVLPARFAALPLAVECPPSQMQR